MRAVTRLSLIALAAVALTGSIAHAQITETIRFTTTFPFTAGRTALPAGTYSIAPLATNPDVLELSDGRRTVALLEVGPASGNQRSGVLPDEVIFTRTGHDYVLCQIWDEADRSGAQIAGTFKLTRGAQAALADASPAAQAVIVPASHD